jgi:hypothetical protein
LEDAVDDQQVHARIEQLVADEHRLWEAESRGRASETDRKQLADVRVALDRCWDLLRQRRAHEEFGLDPDSAASRPADTVEHYQQ